MKTVNCQDCEHHTIKGISLYCKLTKERKRFYKPRSVLDSAYGFKCKCENFKNRSTWNTNKNKNKIMKDIKELKTGYVYYLKGYTSPKIFNGLYFECLTTDQKIPANCDVESETNMKLEEYSENCKIYKPERFMQKLALKKNYNDAVEAYIKEFEIKNEIVFDFWIGDEIGGVCAFGDYSFDFPDVKYTIDNKIKFEWFVDWYYFVVEYQKCYINLDSYCRMRRDAEKSHFFTVHDFEKKLLHDRI